MEFLGGTPAGMLTTFLVLTAAVFTWTHFVARKDRHAYTLAFVLGSAITGVLFISVNGMLAKGIVSNPFLVAGSVLGIAAAWRFLFGPWGSHLKATVLGTFIFWYGLQMLAKMPPTERLATLLATGIAIIPALIWCLIFLHQHRERLSVVVLTFFSGMLSTAPILFYDLIQRKGIELHFFLFRVAPENLNVSSKAFVSDTIVGVPGIHGTVLVTLVSFLLVGTIEELSKNWVVRKSDRNFFSSIDDVIELSIIAAIGFAFAENVVNPTYFSGFVQNYLIDPPKPLWGIFLGGVLGRAVITNMVHIVSSGLFGYYYGLAFYASPVLRDEENEGRRHPIILLLHRILHVKSETIYYEEKIVEGFLVAIGVHGLFDFLVTLPEVLPGNPQTIGDLLGIGGALGGISLFLVPSLLYTVGGWLLLVYLFNKKENLKEFGHVVDTQVFEQRWRKEG
jgi:RsiW-degrading membrane proteinase PrsW (M82 family)